MQHIGKKIKMLVDKSGMKQKDIAAALSDTGVSIQQLQYIFGKENVDTKYLVKFSEILKVPIIEFFGEGNTKEYNELLATVESQNEYIKNLKRKIYVIESTSYSIKRSYLTLFKVFPSLLSEIRSKALLSDLESLIRAALDAITLYDKDPDKLKEYYDLIGKLTYLEPIIETNTDNDTLIINEDRSK